MWLLVANGAPVPEAMDAQSSGLIVSTDPIWKQKVHRFLLSPMDLSEVSMELGRFPLK
jgi:hypothetical protein